MKQEDKKRHGGPHDRGNADYYYNRSYSPHYFRGSTYNSPRVGESDMTEEEIQEYANGWARAELIGDRKDYR